MPKNVTQLACLTNSGQLSWANFIMIILFSTKSKSFSGNLTKAAFSRTLKDREMMLENDCQKHLSVFSMTFFGISAVLGIAYSL